TAITSNNTANNPRAARMARIIVPRASFAQGSSAISPAQMSARKSAHEEVAAAIHPRTIGRCAVLVLLGWCLESVERIDPACQPVQFVVVEIARLAFDLLDHDRKFNFPQLA